jgi:beta-glucanase (GH16 family)
MASFGSRARATFAVAAFAALSVGGRCGGDTSDPSVTGGPFDDEFDGPAGERPNSTRWTYDVGGKGFGNNQLEFDTDRPENASLDGQGHLAIVAREEGYQGNAYTSARLVSRGLFSQTYGHFAARMKLPTGAGIWPAFWLLGANINDVGWPTCGEIDVMEYKGQEPGVVHGSLHGPGYSGGSPLTQVFALPIGKGFDEDFHVFSVDWAPGRIAFAVDQEVYQTFTPNDATSHKWVFDHPFYIILNLAVGGTYVGSPDASTTFPQTLLVDWVRVTSEE